MATLEPPAVLSGTAWTDGQLSNGPVVAKRAGGGILADDGRGPAQDLLQDVRVRYLHLARSAHGHGEQVLRAEHSPGPTPAGGPVAEHHPGVPHEVLSPGPDAGHGKAALRKLRADCGDLLRHRPAREVRGWPELRAPVVHHEVDRFA